MATQADLEARIRDLEDIEAIKKLQHKYFRCIDGKLFDELAECFTEDVKTAYDGTGAFAVQGKDAVMKSFQGVLGKHTVVTCHQFHNSEIEKTSETTARGTWQFSDYVIDTEANTTLQGAGFHYDEYIKEKGVWKIKLASFTRIFEETWDREDVKSLKLTSTLKYPYKRV